MNSRTKPKLNPKMKSNPSDPKSESKQPKPKVSELIRRNVEMINNSSEVLQKRQNLMNKNKELIKQLNERINRDVESSMKKCSNIGLKHRNRKTVSFSSKRSEDKTSEMIRQCTEQLSSLGASGGTSDTKMIGSDSDSDNLCIDLSYDSGKESDQSISDSNDSFDAKDEAVLKRVHKSKGKACQRKSRPVEDRSKCWTNRFNEELGDSSKVIEITLDDEDNDKFEPLSRCQTISSTTDPDNKVETEANKSVSDSHKSTEEVNNKCHSYAKVVKTEKQDLSEVKVKQSLDELKQTIGLDKNFLNESQTTFTKVNKPTDKYMCVFCPLISVSSETAKMHYMSHCGVSLQCGECHEKFGSLQTYRKHNSQHLDRNKMLFLDEFMGAKKWSDLYIDYIERHEEMIDNYMNDNKMFCPVCHQIRQFYGLKALKDKMSDKCVKSWRTPFDEEFVRNHLHQHLQYFPYECIDCQFDDKKTGFCLNSKARQHLLEVHNIENAFDLKINELKTYFDIKKSIKKLDHFIDYCLSVSIQMNSLSEKLRQKCDKRKIFVFKS